MIESLFDTIQELIVLPNHKTRRRAKIFELISRLEGNTEREAKKVNLFGFDFSEPNPTLSFPKADSHEFSKLYGTANSNEDQFAATIELPPPIKEICLSIILGPRLKEGVSFKKPIQGLEKEALREIYLSYSELTSGENITDIISELKKAEILEAMATELNQIHHSGCKVRVAESIEPALRA